MNVSTKAAQDVLAERQRQIEREGWTPEHDDQHGHGEMAMAAACYAAHSSAWQAIQYDSYVGRPGMQAGVLAAQEFVRRMWPWSREWWKPKDTRRNLVRAAALLLAEIERLDRASGVEVRGQCCCGDSLIGELANALRIHHEWCIKHQPGYSEHGADAVAYRSTAALLERASGVGDTK